MLLKPQAAAVKGGFVFEFVIWAHNSVRLITYPITGLVITTKRGGARIVAAIDSEPHTIEP